MRAFCMEEIAKITGGRVISGNGSVLVTSVSKDSREVSPDSLFFAVIGKVHDAHGFLEQVYNNGCSNWVISHQQFARFAGSEKATIVLVNDTTEAFVALAVYALDEMKTKKIAVTGSVGKTSTKDMVYAICQQKYKTDKTHSNLNTNIGISMCVLGFESDTQVAVLEMGTDHPGEIKELVQVFRPDVALITNIGQSHLEHFGTREAIFKGKMEITTGFGPTNVLIIQEGQDYLRKENIKLDSKVLSVGTQPGNDFIVSEIREIDNQNTEFILMIGDKSHLFRIPVAGRHQAMNAAQAVACGLELGVSPAEAARGLALLDMTPGRLEIKSQTGFRRSTVIDDSYNASPDSMKAGVDCLMAMKGPRKVAILGDMYELGDNETAYHQEVGAYTKAAGVDLILGVGERAKYLVTSAGMNAMHYETKQALIADLPNLIEEGDVILVKASRGMALDEVVEYLMNMKETA